MKNEPSKEIQKQLLKFGMAVSGLIGYGLAWYWFNWQLSVILLFVALSINLQIKLNEYE